MEKWVQDIYEAATLLHKEFNLNGGMAIFYSPIIYNPKILFVGDNPGGINGTVHSTPPKSNFYLTENYKLATIMREQIFYREELKGCLNDSVIINRVFFQSINTNYFKQSGLWQRMEKVCFPYVDMIIKKINPEIVFAESITAFESLIYGLKGHFGEVLISDNGRGLFRSGEINGKLILGMKHPSSSYSHLSNQDFEAVSKKLLEIL